MAGLHVRIGSISPEIKKSTLIELPGGESITLEPVVRIKGRIGVKDFDPCTILLNNDLATGIPGILEDLHQQYLLPPLHASWAVRRKSTHFACYEEIAKRFGKLTGIDPWLINPLYESCGDVDLADPKGLAALSARVDSTLSKVRRKYKEYGIKEKPFVIVKADNSSSGMGLMTLRDAKQVPDLVARTQAAQPQDGSLRQLIVQEGVLTHERMNDAVAEPVVYMMDRYVVGGFYRIHADRGADENLSAPGSLYVPLAFGPSTQLPQLGVRPGASEPNRFYMYGVVGRLAMLAASYELEATDPLDDEGQ